MKRQLVRIGDGFPGGADDGHGCIPCAEPRAEEAGQFGDLFASCLKRSADVKDFSETLPGHGGVLDRLDSVLLCAPVVLAFCILALLS